MRLSRAARRAGIAWVGPWRHKLEPGSGERIRSAGLRVSSLCRGGFFPAGSDAERRERDADNRRAVEEAAELGTDVLVLVCGGARGPELDAARAAVLDGIERLVPHAREHGVKLAVESAAPDDGGRALGDRDARPGDVDRGALRPGGGGGGR